MSVRAAFAAHTRGGWRAAAPGRRGGAGAGGAGDVRGVGRRRAGCRDGLPALLPEPDEPAPARPVCRRTVLRGETIFDEES